MAENRRVGSGFLMVRKYQGFPDGPDGFVINDGDDRKHPSKIHQREAFTISAMLGLRANRMSFVSA